MKKAMIFDSSTLITLSMNGLTEVLRDLKKIFNGNFIITREIKREVIDKPITIKRFELEALRIKQLLDEGVLELPSSFGINEEEIEKKGKEILDIANRTFISSEKDIHLISLGEATCLVLSKVLSEKGINSVIAIDERTTRMLGEKPDNLKRLFEKKLHTKITSKKENYKYFQGLKFIRSSELVYVAYKNKLIKLNNGQVLDALLWAVKLKGCAISGDEITEIKNIK